MCYVLSVRSVLYRDVEYMKSVGSVCISTFYNHVFCVSVNTISPPSNHVFSVLHVFLCEVCFLDMCVYIEYMKDVGSMIETLNE